MARLGCRAQTRGQGVVAWQKIHAVRPRRRTHHTTGKTIRAHARRWDPPRYRRAFRALPSTEQEVVAYLLTIWPTLLRNKVVAEMFAIISKLSMDTDGMESKRARFPMARGKKLMDELIFRSERMPAGNKCLNFIANEALSASSHQETIINEDRARPGHVMTKWAPTGRSRIDSMADRCRCWRPNFDSKGWLHRCTMPSGMAGVEGSSLTSRIPASLWIA